ncbi:hypothetical protein EVAR_40622_1 [Eumeta japonica]|uniref:Uncharacterized protein n=1 Tax=Eumeta variegata TaxID=151549 RepID=A0A4C1XE24_EUMVA|nr:hypothetical protein EVAR_40622_1 [Eumeta japonica]
MFKRDSTSISIRNQNRDQDRDQDQETKWDRFIIKNISGITFVFSARIWVFMVRIRERVEIGIVVNSFTDYFLKISWPGNKTFKPSFNINLLRKSGTNDTPVRRSLGEVDHPYRLGSPALLSTFAIMPGSAQSNAPCTCA